MWGIILDRMYLMYWYNVHTKPQSSESERVAIIESSGALYDQMLLILYYQMLDNTKHKQYHYNETSQFRNWKSSSALYHQLLLILYHQLLHRNSSPAQYMWQSVTLYWSICTRKGVYGGICANIIQYIAIYVTVCIVVFEQGNVYGNFVQILSNIFQYCCNIWSKVLHLHLKKVSFNLKLN